MSVAKSLICLGAVAAVLAAPARSRAQEKAPVPKPTAEHKVLATEEGTWDAAGKSYMGGPDAAPTDWKGVEVNAMMTGGMWMISKFEGEIDGQKFEGRGQFGYDQLKKKYIGTWIDSMSPGISVLEGTYDAKTKTMTYAGDSVEPASGMKYSQRMVTVTKDDGSRNFTLYMTMDATGGKEAKVLEIAYTKRK